jgi:hypothetical protein
MLYIVYGHSNQNKDDSWSKGRKAVQLISDRCPAEYSNQSDYTSDTHKNVTFLLLSLSHRHKRELPKILLKA